MKNLATVEQMENLLMTFVQAVDVLRHLQHLPIKLHVGDYRDQLRRAGAEVDDLLILHTSSATWRETQRRSQEVADSQRCPESVVKLFVDPERFCDFVF